MPRGLQSRREDFLPMRPSCCFKNKLQQVLVDLAQIIGSLGTTLAKKDFGKRKFRKKLPDGKRDCNRIVESTVASKNKVAKTFCKHVHLRRKCLLLEKQRFCKNFYELLFGKNYQRATLQVSQSSQSLEKVRTSWKQVKSSENNAFRKFTNYTAVAVYYTAKST